MGQIIDVKKVRVIKGVADSFISSDPCNDFSTCHSSHKVRLSQYLHVNLFINAQ